MNSNKKKGLGRGLSALFGDEKPKSISPEINSSNNVSISDLSRNPYQPRQNFSEVKLEELANSIRKNGIIQPIAVRPIKDGPGKYEIVAGERRWLAAQKAGLHEVPVRILELTDVESLEVAIVENIQRDDLSPVEEAKGYKRLNEEFKYDHESISKLMSKSRSHNYSARKVEYLIKSKKNKSKDKSYDANILKAQERIEKILGLKVNISNKKNNSGRIVIEYKDLDQFELISNLLTKN